MRLNKYLARSGYASRRKCDQVIESGKVNVNGIVITDYSYKVDVDDIIFCNGTLINEIPRREVYLLNKLKGYISTSTDPHGRKKVIDLIKSNSRLFTIGRLDRDTTGAIIITNDGDLANNLMHPKFKIEKVYFVSTKIDISKIKYESLSKGMKIDNGLVVRGKIKRLCKKGGLIHWKVILSEGKNHEVKRIFKALGSMVTHLHRESIAGFSVNNIMPGKYIKIKNNEINKILKLNNDIN